MQTRSKSKYILIPWPDRIAFTSQLLDLSSVFIRGDLVRDNYEGLVNALPKVVGFLQVLWFPPTKNVDRVGWD